MPTIPSTVTISSADVSSGPKDTVVVTSPGLVNALVRNSAGTLSDLSAVSQLDLDSISIDEAGRVVIADKAFAAQLRADVDPATNKINEIGQGCGVGC